MGARILVIEDNPINLELKTYLLQALNHEVVPARDGDEGLALARAQTPDLIICDIQMPGMDGYEVARRLRADPALRKVPLIAVTAYAMVGDHEKAIAAGFDMHVPKPIDPAGFMAVIQALLPGRAAPPMPHKGPPEGTAAGVPAHLMAPRRPCVLLTVDDGPVNVEYKIDLFHAAGYELVPTRGVAEALRLLQSRTVDLVLSDVVMPDGGGFELLRRLRADAATRDLPFIFLTASARDEPSRQRGLGLGADDYLIRPLPAHELLAHIRRCLASEHGTDR
ncbi:MAG: response regulator [Burkholderiales bacterium]|nr:response regulator [Burkholderiales bacterium]